MIQIKSGGTYRLPVRLLDSAGAPVTGKLYSDVTITAYYNDGTSGVVSPAAAHFPEYSGGAYGFKVDSVTAIYGPLVIVVVCSGAQDFVGVYDVVQDLASDATTAATSAASSAATAATAAGNAQTASSGANTAAAAAQAAAVATLNVETGGWTLDSTLNQMTIFAPDNVTVIAKFNCFDASGNPSVVNVYKRVRV